jgi:hypothetical protein
MNFCLLEFVINLKVWAYKFVFVLNIYNNSER